MNYSSSYTSIAVVAVLAVIHFISLIVWGTHAWVRRMVFLPIETNASSFSVFPAHVIAFTPFTPLFPFRCKQSFKIFINPIFVSINKHRCFVFLATSGEGPGSRWKFVFPEHHDYHLKKSRQTHPGNSTDVLYRLSKAKLSLTWFHCAHFPVRDHLLGIAFPVVPKGATHALWGSSDSLPLRSWVARPVADSGSSRHYRALTCRVF